MMSQLYNDRKQTTRLTVTDRGEFARGSFSKTQLVQTNRDIYSHTDRQRDRQMEPASL